MSVGVTLVSHKIYVGHQDTYSIRGVGATKYIYKKMKEQTRHIIYRSSTSYVNRDHMIEVQ